MITSTDIRKDARNHLTNKWGKGALITLAYFVIEFMINILSVCTENIALLNLIISIAIMVISVPISYGLIISFMKLKRGEEVKAFDFLSLGFSNFSRALKVAFSMLGKLILPIILLVVSIVIFTVASYMIVYSTTYASIYGSSSNVSVALILLAVGFITMFASGIYSYIKQLSLVLSYNIAYDEPDLTTKQAVEKSQTLMKGNRGNYFVLTLSFIGWALLAALTLGIGLLWLVPYIQVSTVCFYDFLAEKKSNDSDSTSEPITEVNE